MFLCSNCSTVKLSGGFGGSQANVPLFHRKMADGTFFDYKILGVWQGVSALYIYFLEIPLEGTCKCSQCSVFPGVYRCFADFLSFAVLAAAGPTPELAKKVVNHFRRNIDYIWQKRFRSMTYDGTFGRKMFHEIFFDYISAGGLTNFLGAIR